MPIAITINMYTGSISKKPIIDDLVSVVARPNKNAVAKPRPSNVVNLFIFTIFFQPVSSS